MENEPEEMERAIFSQPKHETPEASRHTSVSSMGVQRAMKQLIRKIHCHFKGHDFGNAVYVSPAVLTFCRRCGREIQDRTFDDLEPMTDQDYEMLEQMEDFYSE